MTSPENYSFHLTDQQEKYLLVIFESAPSALEEAAVEEIFTEIGRLKNLSNFLVKLTCEEATDRLMVRKHSQKVSSCWKCELVTLKNLFIYFCEQELLLVLWPSVKSLYILVDH